MIYYYLPIHCFTSLNTFIGFKKYFVSIQQLLKSLNKCSIFNILQYSVVYQILNNRNKHSKEF